MEPKRILMILGSLSRGRSVVNIVTNLYRNIDCLRHGLIL